MDHVPVDLRECEPKADAALAAAPFLAVLGVPVPVAIVGEVADAVVCVVDVIAVLLRVMAAAGSVLVLAVILGLGVADDIVDHTFVPIILGGHILERLRLLPHLWRDLRTHRLLLAKADATSVPRWQLSQTGRAQAIFQLADQPKPLSVSDASS